MKVIIDTNFLLMPGSLGVDVIAQLRELEPRAELLVIDKSLDELNKIIEEQSKKHRDAAKIGLELVKKAKLGLIKTKTFKNVDEIIVEKVKREGYAVATQDKGLRDAIKPFQTPVFVLRQKKYVLRLR